MKPPTPARSYARPVVHPDDKHVMDYVRLVYKRRWIAFPVFVCIFVVGAVNALRQTPIYQARVQLLIEKDSPNVATLDQMFQAQDGWLTDDFYQTQYRILQSRSLARRTLDMMRLWDVPRLGNGPEPKAAISVLGLLSSAVRGVVSLARMPFADPLPAARRAGADGADGPTPRETLAQSSRIDQFLGGVSIVPVRNSRIVEIRYSSSDPVFAAAAANGVAKAYIQQSVEFRFNSSKEAADWLSGQLAGQRRAVEASEAALQTFRERNGAVSAADSASNIVVARLTELNSALTKAKTERINREALYNQLAAMEGTGAIDALPAILSNDYIQRLKSDLSDLQRQQAQLAERYGERHAEMIKIRTALQTADAKLKVEIGKVVDSVKNEYQAALGEERSLQAALDSQKREALSMNRTSIEAGVLQREVDSNRQIYESLLQRTRETDISSERRSTNVRVVDEAEVPRGPVSPNVPRDILVSLALSLAVSIGLAFGLERLDNRIRTPQELKLHVPVPFLGMVPAVAGDTHAPEKPLVNLDAAPNFVEAFKTLRTNVLFSSAEEGLRTIVVTSAGPGEGKSVVAGNLAVAMAQVGQRVLLIDADMRRPRVHELFDFNPEPGLSNILTGNTKTTEAVRKSAVSGLWLIGSGVIPPNPAELLASRRWLDFLSGLEDHFDWVIVDTPPILAVSDGAIAANRASGVVFVVASDHTTRQAAREAVEQLSAANAHIVGSVLNRVDLVRHPYYYASHYRKDYAKYYARQGV